jgi:hypothetical protein
MSDQKEVKEAERRYGEERNKRRALMTGRPVYLMVANWSG